MLGPGEGGPPEIDEKKKISATMRIKNITEKALFFSNHPIMKSRPNPC